MQHHFINFYNSFRSSIGYTDCCTIKRSSILTSAGKNENITIHFFTFFAKQSKNCFAIFIFLAIFVFDVFAILFVLVFVKMYLFKFCFSLGSISTIYNWFGTLIDVIFQWFWVIFFVVFCFVWLLCWIALLFCGLSVIQFVFLLYGSDCHYLSINDWCIYLYYTVYNKWKLFYMWLDVLVMDATQCVHIAFKWNLLFLLFLFLCFLEHFKL